MTIDSSKETTRAKLKSGYLYAVRGADNLLYVGQVAGQNMVGFLRWRGEVADVDAAFKSTLMFRCGVFRDSIGRALRSCAWTVVGYRELHPQLQDDPILVQWPNFSTQAWLWRGAHAFGHTTIDDPSIQQLEVIGAWDAEYHIAQRLPAEFNDDELGWQWRGRVADIRLQRAMQGLDTLPSEAQRKEN